MSDNTTYKVITVEREVGGEWETLQDQQVITYDMRPHVVRFRVSVGGKATDHFTLMANGDMNFDYDLETGGYVIVRLPRNLDDDHTTTLIFADFTDYYNRMSVVLRHHAEPYEISIDEVRVDNDTVTADIDVDGTKWIHIPPYVNEENEDPAEVKDNGKYRPQRISVAVSISGGRRTPYIRVDKLRLTSGYSGDEYTRDGDDTIKEIWEKVSNDRSVRIDEIGNGYREGEEDMTHYNIALLADGNFDPLFPDVRYAYVVRIRHAGNPREVYDDLWIDYNGGAVTDGTTPAQKMATSTPITAMPAGADLSKPTVYKEDVVSYEARPAAPEIVIPDTVERMTDGEGPEHNTFFVSKGDEGYVEVSYRMSTAYEDNRLSVNTHSLRILCDVNKTDGEYMWTVRFYVNERSVYASPVIAKVSVYQSMLPHVTDTVYVIWNEETTGS